MTKQFDAPIIVGEATMMQARGHSFGELGLVQVAGRAEPVRIFAPTSRRGQDDAIDRRSERREVQRGAPRCGCAY